MEQTQKYIFLTGFLRSGTTLLEKILHNHPEICIGAQPFPFLYYHLKECFFLEHGLQNRRYPLGTLFREKEYTLEQFHHFLKSYILTDEDIHAQFHKMMGYSGQQMQDLLHFQGGRLGGSFLEVFKDLTDRVAYMTDKTDAVYHGAKEVFCEEFIPSLLEQDVKVVIVIRDPRDVVASVNFGKGKKYTGNLSTLHILRKWRKSVAFSLRFQTHPGFSFILYEDLVNNTWDILDRLTDFLGVETISPQTFSEGIRDQSGKLWQGNSSFDSYRFVSNRSAGKYKHLLPDDVTGFIENICYPEMKALHLNCQFHKEGLEEDTIRSFNDAVIGHDHDENDRTAISPDWAEEEIMRYNLLLSGTDNEKAAQWFIFPEVCKILQQAIR